MRVVSEWVSATFLNPGNDSVAGSSYIFACLRVATVTQIS